ncbi:bifunctional tetrahydrofolate synthase/dihydrofolate synthase [Cycloclasticus sp. P1]|uniref:bifunctional tetrahydrofolate synthase/dihydrofolate synthase n=1 Tax=Cycloclasticus sp. (strain P1) TaxID=385025 RepID=UPI000286B007|nr:bifunctional tetrahydrofolate synthase/dihydrofolate synthase [Cycloclasticus sp. P1]AFT67123.1 FolC bifunctional protein [Cycloclasticus sp. P1]
MQSGLSALSSIDEWLAWQEQCHVKNIDLGLERVASVYKALKPTHSRSIYTITVAGTNGKGSCVAMLEAIFIAAGYSVGVYSTPHLKHYNERVRINGTPVLDSSLASSFYKIDLARKETSLSYFEFGTLAAIDVFDHYKVDIQILEVGLGGRLDAVNIVDADAALITSISIDHIDWLGDDRNQIALEKAGVFRANQIAVCGDSTVPNSLIDYAKKLGTQLSLAGKDFDVNKNANDWSLVANHVFAGHYPMPVLQGYHQIKNAAAVVSLLANIQHIKPVSKNNIDIGLRHTSLKGRLQQVSSAPDIFLDVAHNAESAQVLSDFLKSKKTNGQLHAVFSVLADKQLNEVLKPFIGLIDNWHIAPLQAPRALSVADLYKSLVDDNSQQCFKYSSIQQALKNAKLAAKQDDLVICFGSFYVVEACLEAL